MFWYWLGGLLLLDKYLEEKEQKEWEIEIIEVYEDEDRG